MIIDTEEKRILRKRELEEEQSREEKERNEAKKNKNFVQLYRNNMPELRWLVEKSAVATKVLFFLMEHMDTRNALACSYAVLEDYFGLSRMTLYRAIKILEENGFINTLKMGTSHVYTVNYEVAWSSWDNQKKYAKLDGTILVSHKENKDYDYQRQSERFKTLRQREKIKVWKEKIDD